MEFKTEITYAAIAQPFVYDVQSRHLFGYEQNPASPYDIVYYYIRYGLRLARSRGSVQNERTVEAGSDCLILRTVRAYRQIQSVVSYVCVVGIDVSGRHIFQSVVDGIGYHRPDKRRFPELIDIVSDVVPHQIIREGQRAKIDVVDYFPAFFIGDFAFYARRHRKNLGGRSKRNVPEPPHIEAEFLIEKFEQRVIYLNVFGIYAYPILRQRYALFFY